MKSDLDFLTNFDPFNIPEFVRDRFAQLTISSKKKKEREKAQENLSEEIVQTQDKSSACRNLRDLLTDDESEAEEVNKLFQSKNSAATGGGAAHRDSVDPNVSSFVLERLQVSISNNSSASEQTNLNTSQDKRSAIGEGIRDSSSNRSESLFTGQEDMGILTTNVSEEMRLETGSIGLLGRSTTTKSSAEEESLFRSDGRVKGIALADTVSGGMSEIISVESHRSSLPRKMSLEIMPLKENISLHDKSVVTISSTSSSPSKDSISVSETDEEVIVLSDSEGENSHPVNVSNTRPSGQTNLGSTLSNTLADRIEAFLKDVSATKHKETQSNEESLESSFRAALHDAPLPEDSIEICETEGEEEEVVPPCVEEDVEKEETISSHKGSEKEPEPQSPPKVSQNNSNCIEKINISATIKIKVQISEPKLTEASISDYDDNSNDSSPEPKPSKVDRNSIADKAQNNFVSEEKLSVQKELATENKSLRKDASFSNNFVNKASEGNQTAKETSIEFDEKAKKLLDQLYGSAWQTPEIIKTLERKGKTEETRLNFSEFRNHIKEDLESTRVNLNNQNSPKVLPEQEDCFKRPCDEKDLKDGRVSKKEFNAFVTKRKGVKPKNAKKIINRSLTNEDYSASDDSWICTSSSSESDDSCGRKFRTCKKQTPNKSKLIYLDLSAEEVQVKDECGTPAVNNDKAFNERLQEILKTCKYEDRPKIASTPTTNTKTKRKLFTARFGEETEGQESAPATPIGNFSALDDSECVRLRTPLPLFAPINKQLEAVKTGTPIFNLKTPTSKKKKKKQIELTSTPSENCSEKKLVNTTPCGKIDTPRNKYGFLKSLDVSVSKALCHPDALYYRENFKTRKDELVQRLYGIYNEKLFNNELNVAIVWNKKLLNTAGRCSNKKMSTGERASKIELSEKVLTSADRLRCTLIHELCHAATWIFNGENGHGATWKAWARKANEIFPEIPKIGVCHQYDIEYKYTYKCTLCGARSHAHSKSKKVENIRCSFCHGAIEIFLNKKDKDGNIIPTPVKEPSGFAKFVKEKYKVYKRPDLKHTDVMKILSNEFASLSITEKKKY